jgi:hypothetical protein
MNREDLLQHAKAWDKAYDQMKKEDNLGSSWYANMRMCRSVRDAYWGLAEEMSDES